MRLPGTEFAHLSNDPGWPPSIYPTLTHILGCRMEVLIRKTPAFDTGKLALARNLRKKSACRQTGRTWAKERSQTVWLSGAALISMMEFPDLGNFHNAAVRWFLN